MAKNMKTEVVFIATVVVLINVLSCEVINVFMEIFGAPIKAIIAKVTVRSGYSAVLSYAVLCWGFRFSGFRGLILALLFVSTPWDEFLD